MKNNSNKSIKAKFIEHREPVVSAHIVKSTVPHRQGFFLVNKNCHMFFTRYSEAKEYAEGRGWDAERC